MMRPKDGVPAWERPHKTALRRGFLVMGRLSPAKGRARTG